MGLGVYDKSWGIIGFFWGDVKFLGVFWVVFCCCVVWDFVGYLESGFADGELLSFTRVKESNQRKHAPTKPLLFATQHS